MNPVMVVAAAAGGAIGAVPRYLLATKIGRWVSTGFPWGTFAVNVPGCAGMVALVELMALSRLPSPDIRALPTVGLLGGFATFAAFSLDAVLPIERQQWVLALLYVVGSVLLPPAIFVVDLRFVLRVVA